MDLSSTMGSSPTRLIASMPYLARAFWRGTHPSGGRVAFLFLAVRSSRIAPGTTSRASVRALVCSWSSVWTVACHPSESATFCRRSITSGASGVMATMSRGPTYTVLRGRTPFTASAVPGSRKRPETMSSTWRGGTKGSRWAESAPCRNVGWLDGRSGGVAELMATSDPEGRGDSGLGAAGLVDERQAGESGSGRGELEAAELVGLAHQGLVLSVGAQLHGQWLDRHHPAVEPGAVLDLGEPDVDAYVGSFVLEHPGPGVVSVLRSRMAYAGQGTARLDEGEKLELEVLGGDGGEHAVDQVDWRGVDLLPDPRDRGQQGGVVRLRGWTGGLFVDHQNPPACASSRRSLSRHRPRVGPIEPTGM